MIRIRVDDVMWQSRGLTHEKCVRQITKIGRWLHQAIEAFEYVPTIIVSNMEAFPEVTALIKSGTEEGAISPQIHGYEHIDYGKLKQDEIESHLDLCMTWFDKELNTVPTVWATPWGGTSPAIVQAATKFSLTVETTKLTIPPGKAISICKSFDSIEPLHGRTIMLHWWEKGLRLLRLVEIHRRKSYGNAVLWDKQNRKRKERIF